MLKWSYSCSNEGREPGWGRGVQSHVCCTVGVSRGEALESGITFRMLPFVCPCLQRFFMPRGEGANSRWRKVERPGDCSRLATLKRQGVTLDETGNASSIGVSSSAATMHEGSMVLADAFQFKTSSHMGGLAATTILSLGLCVHWH